MAMIAGLAVGVGAVVWVGLAWAAKSHPLPRRVQQTANWVAIVLAASGAAWFLNDATQPSDEECRDRVIENIDEETGRVEWKCVPSG
jgi:hypothetical protein